MPNKTSYKTVGEALKSSMMFFNATGNKRLDAFIDPYRVNCPIAAVEKLQVKLVQPQAIDIFNTSARMEKNTSTSTAPSAKESTGNAATDYEYRIVCPLPYNPKSMPYDPTDEPWTWDTAHKTQDVHGQRWYGVGNK